MKAYEIHLNGPWGRKGDIGNYSGSTWNYVELKLLCNLWVCLLWCNKWSWLWLTGIIHLGSWHIYELQSFDFQSHSSYWPQSPFLYYIAIICFLYWVFPLYNRVSTTLNLHVCMGFRFGFPILFPTFFSFSSCFLSFTMFCHICSVKLTTKKVIVKSFFDKI